MVKKTNYYMYVLNIISCFAVVLLHTSLLVFNVNYSSEWLQAVIVQAFNIFAVPIFFMISGANLLGYRKRYSTTTFFSKRFTKIGIALLGGSIICYAIFALFPEYFYAADQLAQASSLKDFAKRFLTNQINDVYWFLYSIIYLYILTPILSKIVENKKILEYTLCLLIFVSIVIPVFVHFGINKVYFHTLFNWPFFSTSGLLYYLLGYYICEYVDDTVISSKLITIFSGICAVIASISMAVAGLIDNHYFDVNPPVGISYKSYWISTQSPLCVIQAVALFICLRSLEPYIRHLSQKALSTITLISSATLGIYLFHILVINWLPYTTVFPQMLNGIVTKAIVVYVLTGIAVLLGKHIIAIGKRAILLLHR